MDNIVLFSDLPCTSTCRTLWPDCSTPESGSLTPHSHHTRCRPSRQASGNTCHLYQAQSQYTCTAYTQYPHIKISVPLVFSHIFIFHMSRKQSSDVIITLLYLNVICEPQNTVLLTINLKGVHYTQSPLC